MIDIVVYEEMNQDEKFYSIMGRFFALKEYEKEMGWPIYNKEKSVWFLAYKDNELVGFCSIFYESTHIFLDNVYIIGSHRRNGYSSELLKCVVSYVEKDKKEIRAITDNVFQMNNFINSGFTHYGYRGRYNKYKK